MLLRDILKGDDPQLIVMRDVVAQVAPDILVVQRVDFDHGLATLGALRDWIAETGPDYPHIFALPPNTGLATDLDLDGDGRLGGPGDAQGYAEFFGAEGMAILSRYPIDREAVQDYSALLWVDFPDALLPEADGAPFPSPEAQAIQRLSTVGHWVVPVVIGDKVLTVLAFHASPPVFDGPEDRNGRRNHDEVLFWQYYLDGAFDPAPSERFVIMGTSNLDPSDGDGRREAMKALLDDPRLQDPRPMRPDGSLKDHPGHSGDPRFDTVAWPAPEPGHMRVDVILPSADLTVTDAGVHWPPEGDPQAEQVSKASRHRMVWVDIDVK